MAEIGYCTSWNTAVQLGPSDVDRRLPASCERSRCQGCVMTTSRWLPCPHRTIRWVGTQLNQQQLRQWPRITPHEARNGDRRRYLWHLLQAEDPSTGRMAALPGELQAVMAEMQGLAAAAGGAAGMLQARERHTALHKFGPDALVSDLLSSKFSLQDCLIWCLGGHWGSLHRPNLRLYV